MSDQGAKTPRVFIMRHGQTEWAKLGRFTGVTDIDLTQEGREQVSSTAAKVVGTDQLLDPAQLHLAIVSPRKRARTTFELLLPSPGKYDVRYTEEITEWDYGHYEGLLEKEIKDSRKKRGLDAGREWNIWRDGCEGGESTQQVSNRLDRLIGEIQKIQEACMKEQKPGDVLIVAHGLILRCFVKRWIGVAISEKLAITMDPGAIAVVSYKNNDMKEPVFQLGTAL